MEATTAIPYKLKVRLGANEFDAEGPEDSVKEQYALFLEHLAAEPKGSRRAGDERNVDCKPDDAEGDGADIERLWNRAYRRKDDQVSLHVLPQTKTQKPDSIVLLLYGFQTLLDQESVTALDLMEAAKQSGLRIDRIDRSLPSAYNAFIIRGGSGKGSRYSLNNRGLSHAQELLDELFA